jgi:hypothetical protein
MKFNFFKIINIVWIAASAFGLLAMTSQNIYAAEPLKVTYGIYAGGFHVVDMTGTYIIDGDNYAFEADLDTVGMLGKLVPWSGLIESNGINKGVNSTPLNHIFASTWRGDTETKTFTFDQDGKLISYLKEEDGEIEDKMPESKLLEGNPIDMLTAMFRAMNGQTCESTSLVTDGKRTFDMAFRSKGLDMVDKSKYSAFEGEAEICEVEIIPVAGKWREKPRGWMSIQEQAKGKGQLPRMWFGKVREDMPNIPVRFFIKTNYGAMVMHLRDVS